MTTDEKANLLKVLGMALDTAKNVTYTVESGIVTSPNAGYSHMTAAPTGGLTITIQINGGAEKIESGIPGFAENWR